MNLEPWLVPDWPAPTRVRSFITTRHGGVSMAPYASLNLGDHVGDDPAAVAANRQRLRRSLPAEPCWLQQVHGTTVLDAGTPTQFRVADGAFARNVAVVCVVMTADCLPVLLCDRAGTVVAAAHAGWRSLQAGILERTVAAMAVPGIELIAYLGPAIGPQAFEVGGEVRAGFVGPYAEAAAAFKPLPQPVNKAGGWLANIYLLARQRLAHLGVEGIYGGEYCTFGQESLFFSYRRDGVTGRMASLIWLSE
ncbi:MAG: peptidoglycan editing factor PgeF [Candidatus Accumulibacter sp.]|uniref:Purine nucleoside phosphorylase n=1 Tax=Candidatus Accumulibacter cognatus TaxID=2954383 RepID=A0A7D5NCZ0_9PROT|nr:peptidoglycan editing factor PgeF [Accumulibacter sp.]QLH51946.1 MAG: peptidoglycan editing factor PgeF [Candidatus Accumulibacter cognatus]MBN8519729.1 peptidoglycan editing factor PgeF [Accumulibacter sp.]MBO3709647.1 peptidoglycan editing factor PgeF [Accumulibacter sp.]HMW55842.1 peptidoglycan editing factor PgeF [Accumulibacter sp.]HNC20544.1 peptidoglycan editing factor PgeF [Accumulibacter sp.]